MNSLTSAFPPYGALGGTFPLTWCVPVARMSCVVTVRPMPYPSDPTDEQWDLLEPVFQGSTRGRSFTACRQRRRGMRRSGLRGELTQRRL